MLSRDTCREKVSEETCEGVETKSTSIKKKILEIQGYYNVAMILIIYTIINASLIIT